MLVLFTALSSLPKPPSTSILNGTTNTIITGIVVALLLISFIVNIIIFRQNDVVVLKYKFFIIFLFSMLLCHQHVHDNHHHNCFCYCLIFEMMLLLIILIISILLIYLYYFILILSLSFLLFCSFFCTACFGSVSFLV